MFRSLGAAPAAAPFRLEELASRLHHPRLRLGRHCIALEAASLAQIPVLRRTFDGPAAVDLPVLLRHRSTRDASFTTLVALR